MTEQKVPFALSRLDKLGTGRSKGAGSALASWFDKLTTNGRSDSQ